jgi:hypothetical protein
MARAESDAHLRLKQLALDWARAAGFTRVAPEVRVPRSGYRADVAAARDGAPADAEVALFECKQARADLRKDVHAEAATRERLAALIARRAKLEQLLAVHRPDLRRGEALWPEFDRWDFSSLEHRTHRRLTAEIAMLQRRALGGTKFSRMVRYRCADRLWLVVEDGLFAPAEWPDGWGVLVREAGELHLVRPAPALAPVPEQRAALRASLAAALAWREAGRGSTSGQTAYTRRHA